MNKKITIIDLVNIIAKNQDIPQRIKVDKDIYIWDTEEFYKREDGKDLFRLADFYDTIGFLELEVEILEDNTEDNTEEIEELEEWITRRDGEVTQQEGKRLEMCYKINELVRAVNKLRKEKSNDK